MEIIFRDWYVPQMAVRVPQTRGRGRPRRASASTDILDAALELLAERGFQAATIGSIATRAGVGRNTIYRRWSSKEELIADALQKLLQVEGYPVLELDPDGQTVKLDQALLIEQFGLTS